MAKSFDANHFDLKDTDLASIRDNSIVNMSENTKAHTHTVICYLFSGQLLVFIVSCIITATNVKTRKIISLICFLLPYKFADTKALKYKYCVSGNQTLRIGTGRP